MRSHRHGYFLPLIVALAFISAKATVATAKDFPIIRSLKDPVLLDDNPSIRRLPFGVAHISPVEEQNTMIAKDAKEEPPGDSVSKGTAKTTRPDWIMSLFGGVYANDSILKIVTLQADYEEKNYLVGAALARNVYRYKDCASF